MPPVFPGGYMPVEKFKTKKCKVLSYNHETQELDVDFAGYGIRLYHIAENVGDYIVIRYRGEIGTPSFVYRL